MKYFILAFMVIMVSVKLDAAMTEELDGTFQCCAVVNHQDNELYETMIAVNTALFKEITIEKKDFYYQFNAIVNDETLKPDSEKTGKNKITPGKSGEVVNAKIVPGENLYFRYTIAKPNLQCVVFIYNINRTYLKLDVYLYDDPRVLDDGNKSFAKRIIKSAIYKRIK